MLRERGVLYGLARLFLVAALGAAAVPAAAQTCIEDVWKAHGNKQNLTCTAQDVTLSQVTNINITSGGSCTGGVCKCFLGGNVTFTATFGMDLTADTRYDIGFYIATDGDLGTVQNPGALTGTCQSTNVTSTNGLNFINLDTSQAGDTCGDITGPLNTDFNPQAVNFTVTMPCTDPDENGQLDLPWCTTWRQPGANDVCDEPGDAYPGSPSKCNCGLKPIDIFFETAAIVTTKTARSPATVAETGGSAVYDVTVTNNATVATVTLDSLTDDKYGDITTVHAAGGGFLAVTQTTCTLATIQPGVPYSCYFTGTVPAGDTGGTFVDTVTACGTDSFGHPNLCDDDDATVTYTDVPEVPSLTKAATGTACQIDATYSVVVTNNSLQDVLTLTALSDDKFGSITSTHAASAGPPAVEEVLSTTCAVPQSIQYNGHASGNTYTCSFVGRITSCSINHTDIVSGVATDDDGVTYQPPGDASMADSASVVIGVTTP